MAFANSHNVNIDRSAFYDIQGNYYNNNTSKPGERGIHELFKASCPDAFHDSQARNPPPRCLPGTRVGALQEILDWIANVHERILWISGPAGAGKSAIGQTVAEACADNSTLAGSFFFFRGAQGRDTAEHLIPSIVYQLVTRMPLKRAKLGEIIEEDLSILHKPHRTQIQKLILPLFIPTSLDATNDSPLPFLIIIDGLDECQGDNNQRNVIDFIGALVNTASVPLSFIIISRPEPQIADAFRHLTIVVNTISLSSPHHADQAYYDIYTYLQHGFNEIYQHHNLVTEQFWPSEIILSELVRKSGGAFIYASTVLKYVDDQDFHPVERLNEMLNNSPGLTPFTELDHVYRCIMGASKSTGLLLRVLTVMLFGNGTFWSFGLEFIEKLLQLREGTIKIVLRRMRSIIDIDGNSFKFYHKSFTDFILVQERAQEFFIDTQRGHAAIAQMLLRYISLHADNDDVFRYATHYWDWHCEKSGRWDENPQLLEDISKALDSYDHLSGRNALTQHLRGKVGKCLEWFGVDEHHPPGTLKYPPSDIQYQLFKLFWKDNTTPQTTVYIFTFYEDTGLGELMEDCFRPRDTDLFINYSPKYPKSYREEWPCWIFTENRKSSFDKDNLNRLNYKTVDPLVRRLLQEPGNLEQYKINIVDSHVEVVGRCLEIFSKGYLLHRGEPEGYSYARKYWTKHLSHIPPRNPRILEPIKKLEHSKLHHTLSTDDIRAVEAWLQFI